MRGSLVAVSSILILGACKKPPCPGKLGDLPAEKQHQALECTCAPGAASGNVWGADIFTGDSSVCAAAELVGAIPATGGEVVVTPAPGCQRYRSAKANGISSSSWRSFETSFFFAGHGPGTCPPVPSDPCPDGAPASGALSCTCDEIGEGTVFGTGIYTSDSSLCRAAAHAGAIPAEGGHLSLQAAPGCLRYEGSTAHGVESKNWGPFQGSFFFPGFGDPKCERPAKDQCPQAFEGAVVDAGADLHCTCNSSGMVGTVYGTDLYTGDSSLCQAAVHAGLIPATGGKITARGAPGCSKYAGTARNGVSSSDWGAFATSVFFPAQSAGKCP